MQKINLKTLVTVALLTGLEIVLSRFLSISTQQLKIGFGFIPIAVVAMLYGPVWAGTSAALADFLGAILFPIGAYFPGFTLTAALTGLCYGLLLRGRPLRYAPAASRSPLPSGQCFPDSGLGCSLREPASAHRAPHKPRPFGPPIWRVLLAALIVSLPLNFFLDTLWLHILYGTPYVVLLPTRVLKCVVMFALQVPVLWLISNRITALKHSRA